MSEESSPICNPVVRPRGTRVGIAVVGIGEHARRNILPAIAQCPGLHLVGIASRDKAVVAEESRKYGCEGFATPEMFLRDDRVDVVYITLPVGLHAAWGLRCLRAGKHVWCEKSLAATRGEWNALVAAAETTDRSLCEGFMFLYHRQFRRVLELVDAGELGRLRALVAHFCFPHRPPRDVRYDPALGGGALLDAGCYVLRAATGIARAKPYRMAAALVSDPGCAVDTGGSALLQFPSGVSALLHWGFGCSYRNHLTLVGADAELQVERAFAKPPTLATTLTLRNAAGPLREESIPPDNHFVAMLDHFCATLTDPDARARHRIAVQEHGQTLFDLRDTAVCQHLTPP